jgi:hypothetical protein
MLTKRERAEVNFLAAKYAQDEDETEIANSCLDQAVQHLSDAEFEAITSQ